MSSSAARRFRETLDGSGEDCALLGALLLDPVAVLARQEYSAREPGGGRRVVHRSGEVAECERLLGG
jgi:hypothetical protein